MELKLALVSAFPPGRQSLNEYGLHLAREMAARSDVSEVVVLADRLAEEAPEVVLIAVRPAWVRVRSADGSVLFEKILDAGEEYVESVGLYLSMVWKDVES